MKIVNDVLNFGKWFLLLFFHNRISTISTLIFLAGISLISGDISFFAGYSDANTSLSVNIATENDSSGTTYIGYFLVSLGTILLLIQYAIIFSERVVFYFGNTLKLGDSEVPKYVIPRIERLNLDIQHLDININTYNKQDVIEDYKHNLKTFTSRAFHKKLTKIYLGALGSFPYLYLLGTLIRNGHIESVVVDYDRDGGKWYIPDTYEEKATNVLVEDTRLSIDEKIIQLCNSDSKDIGIAMAYTFEIEKNSIPFELRENTLYLKNSLGSGKDKLSKMQAQVALLDEIALYIDKFKSAKKDVHLFVSAQASFCINLGKRYQDNTMGTIHLYNFNGDDEIRKYDWYITFNKGEIL